MNMGQIMAECDCGSPAECEAAKGCISERKTTDWAHTESGRQALRDAVRELRALRGWLVLPPGLRALVIVVEQQLLEEADRAT
jgi:hypothetical protein